jgi:hypothetical protein
VSGIWALYVYGRRGLRNEFLSFLYGEFWRNMKERKNLYEEMKSNTHEWLKVGRLVALFLFLLFIFFIIPF